VVINNCGDQLNANMRAEDNAQKLKIACYAACAHKQAAITANP